MPRDVYLQLAEFSILLFLKFGSDMHATFCNLSQVVALDAICNVAIDFTPPKSVFIQFGGVTQLVQLSKSMDSTLRLKSLCALRNLMFLADRTSRQHILMELTLSTLASLISGNLQHKIDPTL